MQLSGLLHIALLAGYTFVLFVTAKNIEQTKRHIFARLVQLTLVCLGIDLIIAVSAVEWIWGSTPSARWMSQSIMLLPVILLASLVRMFVARRAAKRAGLTL